MRTLLILAAGLACVACAGGAMPQGGIANYDALSAARAECLAKGGEYQLAKEGNSERLDAFVCKRK